MTGTMPSSLWLQQERQALDLVEQALELAESEQAPWLEHQTASSTALRERAFELLKLAIDTPSDDEYGIASTSVTGSKASDAELSDAATRTIDPNAPAKSPSPHHRGDHIGNYRIDQEIGRGGMGIVYRAYRDDDTFELAVALKVMQALPKKAVQRFESERRILARLNHPNIARILDGGHTEEGAPFLVMELVEGKPIDQYCDQQRMPLRQRIELFLEVCDAVLHAHRRLVVHRDLKPGNILVTEKAQPKLLDFGIAKLIDLDQPDATLTQFGLGAMTPEYASPEQVRQELITVGSDVYSLGVILFELLTGRRPYQLLDRSPRNIERVVCDTRPPSPSRLLRTLEEQDETNIANLRTTSGDRLARDLNGDLDAIVLTALEKDTADRYGSVEELADDLRSYLGGKPVQARAQTWAYLSRRFLARNRRQVAIAAAVVLTTLGGLSVGAVQSLRAGREGQKALLEAQKLEQTNQFLDSLFTAPDPLWGMGKETTVAELLEVAVQRIEDEGLDDASAVLRTIGSTFRNLGELEKSVQVLEQAERESLGKFGEQHLETALSRQRLANSVSDLGQVERTVSLIEAALPVFEREDHTDLSILQSQYATALIDVGKSEQAEEFFRKAKAHNDVRAEPILDDIINLNNYAIFLMQDDRAEVADELFREALRIHQQLHEDPSPLYASIIANVAGHAYLFAEADEGAQHYQEAEQLYLESIQICDDLLGQDHPQTITTRASLIDLYSLSGRLNEAEAIATQLLHRAVEVLPAGHPILAYAQVVHGGVRIQQGAGGEVEQQLREAVATRKASLPEGHWLIASAENLLGASLIAKGHFQEAELMLTNTYQVLLEAVGPTHRKTLEAEKFLARAKAHGTP